MGGPSIASGALQKMLATCARFGLERPALLAELEIDASLVDDRDARVPLVKLHMLWRRLLAHASVAQVQYAGERYTPGDYGLVGFVVMTSATLAEALGHFVRYIGLWTDEPGFVVDGATVRAEYRYAFPDGPGVRATIESAFGEIINAARLLTGTELVPRAVRFAHPASADPTAMAAHTAYFGCEVEFDAPAHELVFQDEQLALPLRNADPQLGAFVRDTANRALAQREPDGDSIIARTRTLIADELARTVPSIETIAQKLAVSERTLRRRLAEANTSFRDLLDETRARLARGYVRDRRIPLAEVAFLLGFSEPSTFHRAFKRWTQTTPAEWRERAH